MQIPNSIAREAIILEDEYFDLKGLSVYSKLGISSLRHFIKNNGLPHFAIRNEKNAITKILVKKSEFDAYMAVRFKMDLDDIANEVLKDLAK